jgi:hypothetical protein
VSLFKKKDESEPPVEVQLEPGETVLKKTDKYRGNVMKKGILIKKGETMLIYLTNRRLIMIPSAWSVISAPSKAIMSIGEGTINIQLKDVTNVKKALTNTTTNVEVGGETYNLDFGGILNPKWLEAIRDAVDAAKK